MADVVHLDLAHDPRTGYRVGMPNGGLELAGGDDALELAAVTSRQSQPQIER